MNDDNTTAENTSVLLFKHIDALGAVLRVIRPHLDQAQQESAINQLNSRLQSLPAVQMSQGSDEALEHVLGWFAWMERRRFLSMEEVGVSLDQMYQFREAIQFFTNPNWFTYVEDDLRLSWDEQEEEEEVADGLAKAQAQKLVIHVPSQRAEEKDEDISDLTGSADGGHQLRKRPPRLPLRDEEMGIRDTTEVIDLAGDSFFIPHVGSASGSRHLGEPSTGGICQIL